MKHYIATVHILVKTNDESDACDAIAEAMRHLTYDGDSCFADWEYVRVGKQLLSPVETTEKSFE